MLSSSLRYKEKTLFPAKFTFADTFTSTGRDPDAGKDGGQEEKGVTGDEMVGCHHQLNRREFE